MATTSHEAQAHQAIAVAFALRTIVKCGATRKTYALRTGCRILLSLHCRCKRSRADNIVRVIQDCMPLESGTGRERVLLNSLGIPTIGPCRRVGVEPQQQSLPPVEIPHHQVR